MNVQQDSQSVTTILTVSIQMDHLHVNVIKDLSLMEMDVEV